MALDVGIIFLYMILTVTIGLWYSRVKNVNDYFLGGRNVHWTLSSLSIVATETSALTFISIPGLAYGSGMGFLQVAFGYLLGRVLVSFLLLPRYFAGNFETVYRFIEGKFGRRSKMAVSAVFHLTRLLADGVRLFATALPLTLMMQWDFRVSIIIIALASLAYTFFGGIKSVIITDAIQLTLYLACAVIGVAYIMTSLDTSFFSILDAVPENLTRVFHSGFEEGRGGFFGSYNVISGLAGGALLSVASHGTDHLIVQRVLSCRDLPSARKAMISSGMIIILQFALFLILGLFIRELLQGMSFQRGDEVMPYFITRVIPPGLRGLMLAGIFAAAMSSLSSTINSLSSSTCYDLLEIDRREGMTEEKKLVLSRRVSLAWTAVIIVVSLLFNYTTKALVEVGLSIASVTYGGMMGMFFMGRLKRDFDERAALGGMMAGIIVTALTAATTGLFWLWYTALGFAVSFLFGMSADYILRRINRRNLR